MRVLVAGATGAVGRQLLPLLVGAGHEVVGTTRSEGKAESIRAAGAEPAIVDVHDTDALRGVVTEARPEVVVNELTSLPEVLDYRDPEALAATNALRGQVGPVLAQIAAEAGAHRLVVQSVAFFYAPIGGPVKREDDPLLELPEGSPMADGPPALRALEDSAIGTQGIDGVVLRYGYFYGPGTYYAADGSIAEQVQKAPLSDRRQGHRDLLLRPHRGRRARHPGRGRARPARHLQRRRRRPRAAVASGCPPTPRRSAPSGPGGCRPVARPADRRQGRGRDGDGAARRLEREGEAGARLGAEASELAPGIPRGAGLALQSDPATAPDPRLAHALTMAPDDGDRRRPRVAAGRAARARAGDRRGHALLRCRRPSTTSTPSGPCCGPPAFARSATWSRRRPRSAAPPPSAA